MYELREEVFKFSKERGKCGDWVVCVLWTVIDYVRVGAQLLGLLWGTLEREFPSCAVWFLWFGGSCVDFYC